jgi:hypothetical protein
MMSDFDPRDDLSAFNEPYYRDRLNNDRFLSDMDRRRQEEGDFGDDDDDDDDDPPFDDPVSRVPPSQIEDNLSGGYFTRGDEVLTCAQSWAEVIGHPVLNSDYLVDEIYEEEDVLVGDWNDGDPIAKVYGSWIEVTTARGYSGWVKHSCVGWTGDEPL